MINSDGFDDNINHHTKIKGSKQKILQLKEELNKEIIDFDPKFEKLKVLRECYDITRNRLNEFLSTTSDKNLLSQVTGTRASKIYSALSTLIYTSICCAKCDDLEKFIRKSAAIVPSGIIDLDEWNSILKIARDCREGSNIAYLINENNTLKQSLNVSLFLASDPLKSVRSDVAILRKDVSREIAIVQGEMAYAMELVKGLTEQLLEKCNSDQNVQKLDTLSRDYKKLLHIIKIKDDEINTYENNHLQQKEEYETKLREQEEYYSNKLSNAEHLKNESQRNIDELRALNIKLSNDNNLFNTQLVHLNDTIHNLNNQINELQLMLSEMTEKNTLLETEISKLNDNKKDFDSELVSSKDEVSKLYDLIKDLEKQVAITKTNLDTLTKENIEQTNIIAQLELSKIEDKNMFDKLQSELEALKAQYSLLQTNSNENSTNHISSDPEELSQLVKEIELLRSKLVEEYNQIDGKENSLSSDQGDINENVPGTTEFIALHQSKVIDSLFNLSNSNTLASIQHISELHTLKELLDATAEQLKIQKDLKKLIDQEKANMLKELNDLKATNKTLTDSMTGDSLSSMLPLITEIENLKIEITKLNGECKAHQDNLNILSKENSELKILLDDYNKIKLALDNANNEILLLQEQLKSSLNSLDDLNKTKLLLDNANNEILLLQEQIKSSLNSSNKDAILVAVNASPRIGITNESSAEAIATYGEKQGLENFQISDLQRKLADSLELLKHSKDMIQILNKQINANDHIPNQTSSINSNQNSNDTKDLNTKMILENANALKSEIEIFLSTGKKPRDSSISNMPGGALKPYNGTNPGSTGWYTNHDQLYYFIVENENFLLLCGPIHEDIYKVSIEELHEKSIDTYPLNLSIDRLGLHATRVQIETLLDDMWHLDELLKNTVDELNTCRSLLDRNQIENIEDDGTEVTFNKNSDAFIKLTSLTRGFITRSRVKKMVANKEAMESGILFAMNNTDQGQTGWYKGPNNQIFYFVLKDGNWVHTIGPITEAEFESMRNDRKVQHTNKNEEILYRCNLPLFEAHSDVHEHGHLYIAASRSLGKSGGDKLYVAIPIDSFMPSLTLSDQVSFDGEGSLDDMSLYSLNFPIHNTNPINNSPQDITSIAETDDHDNIAGFGSIASATLDGGNSEVLFDPYNETPLERESPSRVQTRPQSILHTQDDAVLLPLSEVEEIPIVRSPTKHEMF